MPVRKPAETDVVLFKAEQDGESGAPQPDAGQEIVALVTFQTGAYRLGTEPSRDRDPCDDVDLGLVKFRTTRKAFVPGPRRR